MKLYLIRHAESVTDSALTNHGMLQIEKLVDYFRQQDVRFTRVFCSPLQRARVTADALKYHGDTEVQLFIVPCLREKKFGSLEGKSWVSSHAAEKQGKGDFVPAESHEELSSRARGFLDDHLFPLLHDGEGEETVAVVSHGIIMSVLWRTLKQMCGPLNLTFGPFASLDSHSIIWSNTGYLELELNGMPSNLSIKVLTINGRRHLANLKRTRGVGSSKHDPKQRKMESFFRPPP
ncbi:hypothetical protein MaudMau93_003957 [Microsporum audouinii]